MDVAVFIGSQHREMSKFRQEFPLTTGQLLGGDESVMECYIKKCINVPINTEFPVTTGKPYHTGSPATTRNPIHTDSSANTRNPNHTDSSANTRNPNHTDAPSTTRNPNNMGPPARNQSFTDFPSTSRNPVHTGSSATTGKPIHVGSPATPRNPAYMGPGSPAIAGKPMQMGSPATARNPAYMGSGSHATAGKPMHTGSPATARNPAYIGSGSPANAGKPMHTGSPTRNPSHTEFPMTTGNPIYMDSPMLTREPSDWESYKVHIKGLIYNHLQTTNTEGLDWSWVTDLISNDIIEKHRVQLDSSWIVGKSRNNTILVDDYVNRENRTLLSYYGVFEVSEKNETCIRQWSIKIKGNIEIKFLHLNLEQIQSLERKLMAVPKEKLEAARSKAFDGFLEY